MVSIEQLITCAKPQSVLSQFRCAGSFVCGTSLSRRIWCSSARSSQRCICTARNSFAIFGFAKRLRTDGAGRGPRKPPCARRISRRSPAASSSSYSLSGSRSATRGGTPSTGVGSIARVTSSTRASDLSSSPVITPNYYAPPPRRRRRGAYTITGPEAVPRRTF